MNPTQAANDVMRIKMNLAVVRVVKAMAAMKLMAAGRGLSSDAELLGLAEKVADAAVPVLMANFWEALKAHVAKRSGGLGEVHVTIDKDQTAALIVENLDMVVKGESVAITFDGLELLTVKLAKANGPAPTVQVDVHVPAPQVNIQNDVHVPQQATPVVHVHPTAVVRPPFEPTKTEIEYEIGPDGKQRPKAIHRK